MASAWYSWLGLGRGLRSQGFGGFCISAAALFILDKPMWHWEKKWPCDFWVPSCPRWVRRILLSLVLGTEPAASCMGGKHSALELQPPPQPSKFWGFVFAFQSKPCRNAFYFLHTEEQQALRFKGGKISLTLNYHQKNCILTKEIQDSFFF